MRPGGFYVKIIQEMLYYIQRPGVGMVPCFRVLFIV